MAFITPTNVAAKGVLDASRYNQDVVANLSEFAPFFSAWTTFTPTLSASSGGLNLGNTATQTGAFCKIGRVVFWRAQWATGGSGITAGSGNYQFTLPAGIGTAAASGSVIGNGVVYNTSVHGPAMAFMSSTSVVQFLANGVSQIGSNLYNATVPGWFLRVSGCFEASS